MSKMTREERLAAGWVERWGVYDWRDCTWRCDGTPKWSGAPKKRSRYADGKDASEAAAAEPTSWNQMTARRFWTRKRPKPAPKLKVGDEVLVRAKIVNSPFAGPRSMLMQTSSGARVILPIEDVVRAPKEK